MEKIRLGILGVGNQGSMYAKKILGGECPEFELVSIADKNPARIEWIKQNFTDKLSFYASLDEMLDSNTIDACLIEVPHYDHPSSAIACMRRGVHVCVDKPAGVYTKQIREMNEEAKKHDVVFAMMFNQRTNHVYRKMHELVHSGKYGRIRRTNWLITNWYRPQAYYDSGDWRATWSGEGGGVLMNQCPHQLDMWQWICGMPKKVSAHIKYGQWHDIEVDDDVTAYVEYENGATGVFITSTGDSYGTNRFEVQMDKAKLVAEDVNGTTKLTVLEYEQSEPEFSKVNTAPFGRTKANEVVPETDGLHTSHMGVIRAWGGAILRGEPLVADGTEGINGVTLANAMYLSDWLGKTVDLPLDEDLYYEELMKRVATSRRKTGGKTVFVDIGGTYGSK